MRKKDFEKQYRPLTVEKIKEGTIFFVFRDVNKLANNPEGEMTLHDILRIYKITEDRIFYSSLLPSRKKYDNTRGNLLEGDEEKGTIYCVSKKS